MKNPRTMFEKIWADHVVQAFGDNTYLLHVDRSFQHELAAMTFDSLTEQRRRVLCPDLTFATVDHLLDTFPGRSEETMIPNGGAFIRKLRAGANASGATFFDLDDPRQGIIHVIAPELGISLPGMVFVCCDSHTSTIGGIGALAWGIGVTDMEHVMATQCIVQTKPMTMRVAFDGRRPAGVTAKDLVLHLIGQISADGGNGYAIEYAGDVAADLSIEERLTICNMSVELSARSGMFAPDEVTYAYLRGRPFAPKGAAWDDAVAYWRTLPSDHGSTFDREVRIDCSNLSPQVTWGTSPEHVMGMDGRAPDPASATSARERASQERALAYMGLKPGEAVAGLPIDAVFIGSCTNSRVSDLRAAARVLKGRKVAEGVTAICSPGSMAVKREAEAEGIDRIFKDAGFEWREPGCSLCMSGGAGGEAFPERARVISSTNRNFEHRQGRDVRSHLASPETVAASAVAGCITAAGV
ncbi:MAG: 3-isopropylmalate dehydratase large subunit [Caulobacteraceae bacterium]